MAVLRQVGEPTSHHKQLLLWHNTSNVNVSIRLIFWVQWVLNQSIQHWTPQPHLLVNPRSPLCTNLRWFNINPAPECCYGILYRNHENNTFFQLTKRNFIIQNMLPSASCCVALPLGPGVEPQGCNAPGHKFNIQATGSMCFWPA